MEQVTETIKIALKDNLTRRSVDMNINALPEKEASVFVAALKEIPEILVKLDHKQLQNIDKEDIKKWAVIYLNLHNLFHSEKNENDLNKLEILTTAPILANLQEILSPQEQKLLNLAYFSLGLSALKINHRLEYLISEKIILGEFFAIGGIEEGIWGLKLKEEVLPNVAKNVLDKTLRDNHHHLVKKYSNFIFDFI